MSHSRRRTTASSRRTFLKTAAGVASGTMLGGTRGWAQGASPARAAAGTAIDHAQDRKSTRLNSSH